jgi:transcriptional regulator with XRE-family HTH domain
MEKNSKEYRNEYNRFLLKFLIKNYYVSRIELSKAIGLAPSYVREFDNGTRSFGLEALDRFEEFVFSKYSPLLEVNKFELDEVRKEILELNSSEEIELFRMKGADALEWV